MKQKNIAIMAAAGFSKRFGKDKLSVEISGKPLIYWPLKVLEESDLVDDIYIAVQKANIGLVRDTCDTFGFKKVSCVVKGGDERQHSVRNTLNSIEFCNIVLIHDGARPLLTPGLIGKAFEVIEKNKSDGAIPVLPVTDTVKRIEDGRVIETLDRDSLYTVQTPQVFDFKILRECHNKAYEEGLLFSDDAALLENYGYNVTGFEGDRKNIKLTYEQDIKLLDFMMKND